MKLINLKQLPDIIFPLLFILLLFFSYLVISSPLSYEGGDNFIHYKFAHYAWTHKHLFLDHWGKPVFTLLCSPFAQFGFSGAKLFNVITGIATSYITYLTAKQLKLNQSWLVIFLLCFAPIYFVMFNTVMTEILFSFILILSIYLFLTSRFIFSAALISFLPFVRSEGYLFILFFIYAFFISKKSKYIPFLFLGFILYSLIGYFYYYHDFFWVINQNPYNNSSSDIYGRGELLYFIKKSPYITGYAVSILVIAGVFMLLKKNLKNQPLYNLFKKPEFILIVYPSLAYFIIHSLLWWLGKMASVGEIRVMAAIMPLFCLLALKGWNELVDMIRPSIILLWFLNIFLLVVVFRDAKVAYRRGYKTGAEENVVLQASEWLRQSPLFKNKIYYYDPLFFIALGLNPYDQKSNQERIPDCSMPENHTSPGEVVIWDAHFSPNEGRLPLEKLLNNEFFELKKIFTPGFRMEILGGYDYEIYIFQRAADKKSPSLSVLDHLDFEKPWGSPDSLFCTDRLSHEGQFSYRLDNEKMYLPVKTIEVSDLLDSQVIKLNASVYVYPVVDPLDNHTALVASFERDSSYDYHLVDLQSSDYKLNQWNKLSLNIFMPPQARHGDKLKVLIYQPGKHHVFIDNLKLDAIKIYP